MPEPVIHLVPACKTCLYWDPNSAKVAPGQGFCRVMAPVMDDATGAGRWPATGELDFCGEHPHFEIPHDDKWEDRADEDPFDDGPFGPISGACPACDL